MTDLWDDFDQAAKPAPETAGLWDDFETPSALAPRPAVPNAPLGEPANASGLPIDPGALASVGLGDAFVPQQTPGAFDPATALAPMPLQNTGGPTVSGITERPGRALGELADDMATVYRQGARSGLLALGEAPVAGLNAINTGFNEAAGGLAGLFGQQIPTDQQVRMLDQPGFLQRARADMEAQHADELEGHGRMALKYDIENRPDDFVGALGYMAQNPGVVATDLSQMAGNMTTGLVPGAGAAGNIALQATQQASLAATDVERSLIAKGVDPETAKAEASKAFTAALGVGAVAPRMFRGGASLERLVGGEASGLTGRMASRVATPLLGEAGSEMGEEGAVQAIQNAYSGDPLGQGVGGAMAQGAIGGLGMGVAPAAVEFRDALGSQPQPRPRQAPETPDTPAIDPTILTAGNAALGAAPPQPAPARAEGVAPEPADDLADQLLRNLPPEIIDQALGALGGQVAAPAPVLDNERIAAMLGDPAPAAPSAPGPIDFAARTAAPVAQSPAAPVDSKLASGDLAARPSGEPVTHPSQDIAALETPEGARLVAWNESQPGDLVAEGTRLVRRGIRTKREAEALAAEGGGQVIGDGARKFAVVRDEMIGRDADLRERYAPAELIEAEAEHADPGEAPEAATPAVVAEAVQKSADHTPRNLKQAREFLLGKIDEAIAAAPKADRLPPPEGRNRAAREDSRRLQLAGLGHVTFDVPGDGKFRVINADETLADFRAKVEKSQGFRAKQPPKRGPRPPAMNLSDAERARIMAEAETVDDDASVDSVAPADPAAAGDTTAAEDSRDIGEAEADMYGLREAIERAVGKDRVTFLHGTAGLPDRLRRGVTRRMEQRGGRGRTAALYDPREKHVYLFTDVVDTPDKAVWNALHEIAGHHGLREFLGDKLDRALELAAQNPTVRAVADAIARERNLDTSEMAARLLATEEALAELAAAVRTGNFDKIASRYGVEVGPGIRERVADAVKNFLRRLKALLEQAFGTTFTDADVRALLENAWQAAQASPQEDVQEGGGAALESVQGTDGGDSFLPPDATGRSVVADGRLLTLIDAAKAAGVDQSALRDALVAKDAAAVVAAIDGILAKLHKPETMRSTGTKNAVTDANRDPVLREAIKTNEATLQEAMRAVASDPLAGPEAVARLSRGGVEGISVADEAVLLVYKTELLNKRDAAAKRLADGSASEDAKSVARRAWEESEAQIAALDMAAVNAGREWGRFGQFRQRMLRADFTFEALERKERARLERPLTQDESATVKTMADKIADLQAKVDRLQERVANAASESAYEAMTKRMARPPKQRKPLDKPIRADATAAEVMDGIDPANIAAKDVRKLIEALVGEGLRGEPAVIGAAAERLSLSEDEVRALFVQTDPRGPRTLTEAQEELRDLRKLVRLQNEIDRLEAGEPKPPRGQPAVDSPEVAARKQALADLRKRLRPARDSEASYQAMRGKQIAKRIADLQDRIARGDFATRPRVPRVLSEANQRAQFELEKAKHDFLRHQFEDNLRKRTPIGKVFGAVGDAFNLARAVMTSFDLSAILRQGGFIAYGHPVRGLQSVGPSLRAFASDQAEHRVRSEIEARENAPLYRKYGLQLTGIGAGPLTQIEEVYASRWLARFPTLLGGGLVRGSGRAYTSFLNKLRADSFDAMAATLGRRAELTEAEGKAIANYINVATGRGKVGVKESAAQTLNTVFFAPRLVASRFQLLAGQPLYGGTPRTRKMIVIDYARFLIGVSIASSLAAFALGADDDDSDKPLIGLDPRSADFGKIRIGNTYLDPLAGLAQVSTFVARLATGETVNGAGDVKPTRPDYTLTDLRRALGEDIPAHELGRDDRLPFGSGSSASVIGRFLRTKLAPVPGAIINALSGSNLVGEEVTPATAAVEMVTPIAFQDIGKVMQEHSVTKGSAIAVLGLLGMGMQTRDAPSPLMLTDAARTDIKERLSGLPVAQWADELEAMKEEYGPILDGVELAIYKRDGKYGKAGEPRRTADGIPVLKTERLSDPSVYEANYRIQLESQGMTPAQIERAVDKNSIHHIIPDNVTRAHPLMISARTRGFDLDEPSNLIGLTKARSEATDSGEELGHWTSHPRYDDAVVDELDAAARRLRRKHGSLDDAPQSEVLDAIRKVEDSMREKIEKREVPTKGGRLAAVGARIEAAA